ncbi:MAG: bifunctional precorrin-2 dehydrogenase/sirohydrochlorin ferrochelatase [Elusimicrobia bacterium]|nr:bifunctional precorrin-2 dehydrogenase/sirohydrochlorin ferrochelatase [Elusimicrobiota bacterium]
MPNTYLPIGFSVKDKRCLVVGGGEVAVRKIETLLDYDCRITVIAPDPAERIERLANAERLTLMKRAYRSPEASKFALVVSASSHRDVNKTVARDCEAAGVLVNVVDSPSLCGFIFPAILKRDNLTVAVSTDGKSPFLAGHLRLILEGVFPERWKKIAKAAADFRTMVRKRWAESPKDRAACYERFVAADWKEILKGKKDPAAIESELERLLEA